MSEKHALHVAQHVFFEGAGEIAIRGVGRPIGLPIVHAEHVRHEAITQNRQHKVAQDDDAGSPASSIPDSGSALFKAPMMPLCRGPRRWSTVALV